MTDNKQLYDFQKKLGNRKLSPLKSIKNYCREQCCAGDMVSWKNCSFTACLLWKYRLGQGNRKANQKQGLGALKSSLEGHSEGGMQ